MSNSNSPEEKLLRLIKGQKPRDAAAPVAQKQAAPPPAAPVAKVPVRERVRRAVSFFTVNRLVTIALVCASVYLVASLAGAMFGYKGNQERLPAESGASSENAVKNAPSDDEDSAQEKKPVDFYTQATAGKHIFAVEAPPPAEVQVPQSLVNNDAIKDINVIGIIAGADPQVIVEDKKNQKTVYVGKGQSIGDFVVEDIADGKVILNCKGQKYELSI